MSEARSGARTAPESPFFRAWGEHVLAWRWWLLGATVLGGVVCGLAAKDRLIIDSSSEALLSSDSADARVILDLWEDFGQDKSFMVMVEGDVFSMPFLDKLKTLHEDLEGIDMEVESLGETPWQRRMRRHDGDKKSAAEGEAPATTDPARAQDEGWGEAGGWEDAEGWGEEEQGALFEEVTSLVNARQTRWIDGGLRVQGLLDSWPEAAELPELRTRVLKDRSLVDRLVSKSGRHAMVVARGAFMSPSDWGRLVEQMKALAERHQAEGFKVRVTGIPMLEESLNRYTTGDLMTVFSAALGAMFVLLVWLFRNPIGVMAPIFVVLQANLWTFGVMAILGAPMTPVTSVLASFLLCVGTGDAIHIQSVYRDARGEGLDNNAAIVRALASTGMPVLFTSLTTMVGLLSFKAASLGAIQDMGVYGAVGVGLALLHSIVFLPIMLSFNTRRMMGTRQRAGERARDWIDAMLERCDRLSRPVLRAGRLDQRARNLCLLALFLVASLFAVGLSSLRAYHDPLTWFPKKESLAEDVRAVDESLGGTNIISLLVTAPEGKDVKSRELMLALEKLERHILAYRDPDSGEAVAGHFDSVLDVVRESNRALNGDADAHYVVPDTQRGVIDMFTLFQNAGPEQLKKLATVDLKRTIVNVRVKWLEAGAYEPLQAHIATGVARYMPGWEVKLTGAAYTSFTIVQSLIEDMLLSFGTALLVITVMMIVLLGNLRLGLLSMVPNLLPILGILGFMGLAGIPIDLNSLLVASIAIGIAVDDTIHFMHQFRASYSARGSVNGAISHAFSHAGRAMVGTSVVLATGFIVFRFADLLNAQRFGTLVALAVVFALLADLVAAPTLLRTFFRDRPAGTTRDDLTDDTGDLHRPAESSLPPRPDPYTLPSRDKPRRPGKGR